MDMTKDAIPRDTCMKPLPHTNIKVTDYRDTLTTNARLKTQSLQTPD